MVKASFTTKDGTKVMIEGSVNEVQSLLDFYSGNNTSKSTRKTTHPSQQQTTIEEDSSEDREVSLLEIVNKIKDCEESDKIDKLILQKKGRLERVLLPLYIAEKYFGSTRLLTSGNISKIYSDLGISIDITSVSHTLSGNAKKYVIGDKLKVTGKATNYKISRAGMKYMEDKLLV